MYGCPSCKSYIGRERDSRAKIIVPIRCKRWTCKYCRSLNLKLLIQRIKSGKPNKFITLTCQPDPSGNPGLTHHSHRRAIRRLVQMLRRKYGSFEYVCITELHQSGQPHYHLLARSKFIPQSELSRLWQACTGSRVVDIRKIANDRVAACYVAKYVTKNFGPNRPAWLKRIVQFSRGFARLKHTKLPKWWEWELSAEHPEAVVEPLEKAGYEVTPWGQFLIVTFPEDRDARSVIEEIQCERVLNTS